MSWLDRVSGWTKNQVDEFGRTYGAYNDARLAAGGQIRSAIVNALPERVQLQAMLSVAPKKAAPTQKPSAAKKPTAASPERRSLVERAIPFPLSAAMNPMGLGTLGVMPAVIDVNGVKREVTDQEFARSIPAQMRPILAEGERLQYGSVKPDRFDGPNRHLNMRVTDVGVTDPARLSSAMRKYPAPGTSRREPARTGDTSYVGMESLPLPGGRIEHWVQRRPEAIVNSTRLPHVFDSGFAGRMPIRNPDGTTTMVTVSAGTNPFTGPLNQMVGPGQFGLLDQRVASAARPAPGRTK